MYHELSHYTTKWPKRNLLPWAGVFFFRWGGGEEKGGKARQKCTLFPPTFFLPLHPHPPKNTPATQATQWWLFNRVSLYPLMIFIYSHHQSTQECIDMVRQNEMLISWFFNSPWMRSNPTAKVFMSFLQKGWWFPFGLMAFRKAHRGLPSIATSTTPGTFEVNAGLFKMAGIPRKCRWRSVAFLFQTLVVFLFVAHLPHFYDKSSYFRFRITLFSFTFCILLKCRLASLETQGQIAGSAGSQTGGSSLESSLVHSYKLSCTPLLPVWLPPDLTICPWVSKDGSGAVLF